MDARIPMETCGVHAHKSALAVLLATTFVAARRRAAVVMTQDPSGTLWSCIGYAWPTNLNETMVAVEAS